MADTVPYIGRFAPSPTGPLHFGSLVAAVASYLQAKTNDGLWLLRIEDIDPPREQCGASTAIVDALYQYGFEWHGDVIYQSQNHAAHREALNALQDQDLVYACGCSRRDLANAPQGSLGTIYPGTCRKGCDAVETALRLRTDNARVVFTDMLQGQVAQRLESDSGDFVIWRRDGLVAYHLAVVVDDEIQGVTEVVRGIDLMHSTPRQIYLQRLLGLRTPAYMHIPVITHANGGKLSKLTGATGISLHDVEQNLANALTALAQEPPADLRRYSRDEIWAWAIENWRPTTITGRKGIVKTP